MAPPAHEPIQRAATAHAAALLIEVLAEALPAEIVAVSVTNGTVEVRIQVVRRQQDSPGGGCQELPPTGACQDLPGPPSLTPLDQLILGTATHEPQTVQRLANRCNHDPDSYFRERVRRLVVLGLLVRDFHGVCRV